jgi:predicted RNA-binding protein with PUA-like domain
VFFLSHRQNKKHSGIVKVIKKAFLDKSDKTRKFVSVKVRVLYPLKREVYLREIKKNKDFRDFSLVKQDRLSVMRVYLKYWKKICKMSRV